MGNWHECEPTYVWCQGKVMELVRQTDTEAFVKIEWNKTCLQHGDPKATKHVRKKSKWNLTGYGASQCGALSNMFTPNPALFIYL